MQKNENNIIIYQDEDGVTKVSVKFNDEDIWLTQNQIAEIYKTTQENISMHINNIYKADELTKDSTNKKFLLVQTEGNRQVKRNIDHYLDPFCALMIKLILSNLAKVAFINTDLDRTMIRELTELNLDAKYSTTSSFHFEFITPAKAYDIFFSSLKNFL